MRFVPLSRSSAVRPSLATNYVIHTPAWPPRSSSLSGRSRYLHSHHAPLYFLPSFLPPFVRSFLPSLFTFLFLPFLFPSLFTSFLPSFLPSLLSSFRPSFFLLCFLPCPRPFTFLASLGIQSHHSLDRPLLQAIISTYLFLLPWLTFL